ncbi:MAG: flavin reductase family protein [Thermaerobacter sp.]|nr:flavin reductase family protein [Thermaerobacter sp.]
MTSESSGRLLDRAAFRQFVNTVGVLVAAADGQWAAMSAEWCTPVSIEPRLLGVYVGDTRFTWSVVEHADSFGLSLLSEAQAALSKQLGNVSGRDVDKRPWWWAQSEPGQTLPVRLIGGAASWYECRIVDRIQVGDHWLVVGEPMAARVFADRRPLVYRGGRYHQLGPVLEKPQPFP